MSLASRLALVLALALVPGVARAQSMPNDSPAASDLPDASVGVGGADLKSPESQDSASSACTYSSDCERGFVCVGRACVYQRTRDATFEGCGASSAPALAAPALALLGALSRRRRACRTSRSSSPPRC